MPYANLPLPICTYHFEVLYTEIQYKHMELILKCYPYLNAVTGKTKVSNMVEDFPNVHSNLYINSKAAIIQLNSFF